MGPVVSFFPLGGLNILELVDWVLVILVGIFFRVVADQVVHRGGEAAVELVGECDSLRVDLGLEHKGLKMGEQKGLKEEMVAQHKGTLDTAVGDLGVSDGGKVSRVADELIQVSRRPSSLGMRSNVNKPDTYGRILTPISRGFWSFLSSGLLTFSQYSKQFRVPGSSSVLTPLAHPWTPDSGPSW